MLKLHLSTSNRGGFVEHLSLTKVAQQSVTKITYLIFMNLVTPKARAKHEPFVQQTGLRKQTFKSNIFQFKKVQTLTSATHEK